MSDDEKAKKILDRLQKLMRSGNRKTAQFIADEAVAYFQRKKENVAREGESKLRDRKIAELEKYLGDVHAIMGNYDMALDCYKNMKELSKGLGRRRFLVDAYISMGEIHKLRGDWDGSLENFKKALKVAKTSQHQSGEAEAARLIGYVNWRVGNFRKAEDFYKKALTLAEDINDLHIQGKTNIELGNLANESGNLDNAQRYYEKALKILEKVDDKFELARTYNNMGDICIKRQDWVKGIKHFEKCNSIARELRSPRWKGWAMFNAAECYSKSGRPKKAAEYCERAERALSTTEDKMAMAYVQINFGIAYRFLKRWDLAEKHFRNGLAVLEELKSPSVLAWAYSEFGRLKRDRDEKEVALEYMRKAVNMYRKVGAKLFIKTLTQEIKELKNV